MHEVGAMLERFDDIPVEVRVPPLALPYEHGTTIVHTDEVDLGLLAQPGVVAPPAT